MEETKFDKTAFEVVNGFDNASDKEYWKSKTPEERLQAAESLRRQVHGENYDEQGFQRILVVIKEGEEEN